MYICVDGIDGSGKTSLAKCLSKALDCEFYETGLEEDLGIDETLYRKIKRNYFDSIEYSKRGVIWFYLLKMFSFESRLVGGDLVCVRNYASLAGYLGDDEELFDLASRTFTKPTLTILLKPDYNTVCSRLTGRMSDDEIVPEELYDTFYKRVVECYDRYRFKYKVIDTTNMTVEDTLLCVKEIIKNEKIKHI